LKEQGFLQDQIPKVGKTATTDKLYSEIKETFNVLSFPQTYFGNEILTIVKTIK